MILHRLEHMQNVSCDLISLCGVGKCIHNTRKKLKVALLSFSLIYNVFESGRKEQIAMTATEWNVKVCFMNMSVTNIDVMFYFCDTMFCC